MSIHKFMEPTDADAFVDYPLRAPMPEYGLTKPCPRCQGHGGWNLCLNSYPLHDKPDTAENRHQFSHFRSSCGNCHGWGYVKESQTCVHDWLSDAQVGRCLHRYRCKNCDQTIVIDSSD